MVDESRGNVRTLTQAKALAALAHPFRARIIDALKVDGPSTASALASRTGQAVGSASHHLKVLHEAALVEEAPELANDRRERWWRLVSKGTRWSRAEMGDDPAALAAAEQAEALGWRRQIERVEDWFANEESLPDWASAAFATNYWMRLTPGELRELSEDLMAVLDRWRDRAHPQDGVDREPVYLFSRGFPSQP